MFIMLISEFFQSAHCAALYDSGLSEHHVLSLRTNWPQLKKLLIPSHDGGRGLHSVWFDDA